MEPKKAQVQQEVVHYSLRWDGGCASSMYVERLVGTAVVKQLEMWTPNKTKESFKFCTT